MLSLSSSSLFSTSLIIFSIDAVISAVSFNCSIAFSSRSNNLIAYQRSCCGLTLSAIRLVIDCKASSTVLLIYDNLVP